MWPPSFLWLRPVRRKCAKLLRSPCPHGGARRPRRFDCTACPARRTSLLRDESAPAQKGSSGLNLMLLGGCIPEKGFLPLSSFPFSHRVPGGLRAGFRAPWGRHRSCRVGGSSLHLILGSWAGMAAVTLEEALQGALAGLGPVRPKMILPWVRPGSRFGIEREIFIA